MSFFGNIAPTPSSSHTSQGTYLYEAATNGMNFDRFADELLSESAITKMKQHFWTAKQLFRSKLGKKEDEHLLASDAEFDAKLSKYFSIQQTTRQLLAAIEDYHHFESELIESERDLGDFLIQESAGEKKHLEEVMKITGKCLDYTSRQRQKTIRPLIRLYHDLDVFNERAIADCASTVEAAEKARLEYRGSLLWIKKASEELNPNNDIQMEKFRTAQNVVRINKEKFDKLKEDTQQKVELLSKSRTNLLVELAREYSTNLLAFFERSSTSYQAAFDELVGIDTYEIDILKILNDPVGLALEKQREERKIENQHNKKLGSKKNSVENEEDMIQLDDVEYIEEQPHLTKKVESQQKELLSFDDQPSTTEAKINESPEKMETILLDFNETSHNSSAQKEDYFLTNENFIENPWQQPNSDLKKDNPEKSPTNSKTLDQSQKLKESTEQMIDLFRVESPLGFLNDEDEKVENVENKMFNEFAMPSSSKKMATSGENQFIPKLKPPPGAFTPINRKSPNTLRNPSDKAIDSKNSTTNHFWDIFNTNETAASSQNPSTSNEKKSFDKTDWISLLNEEFEESLKLQNKSDSLLM